MSRYENLLSIANKSQELYPEGVPVYVLEPLASRSDSLELFAEGNLLSGVASNGIAESTITAVASPHMTPIVVQMSY